MSFAFPNLRPLLVLGLVALCAAAEPTAAKAPATAPAAKSELSINADSIELDLNKRMGTFVGNVKVSDERMLLLADKMTIYMNENNKPKVIEASGNVVISEVGTQNKAKGNMATYDVGTDMVVLSDNPTLELGEWGVNKAEQIIYDRKNGKFRIVGGGGRVEGGGNVGGDRAGLGGLLPGGEAKKPEEKKEDSK